MIRLAFKISMKHFKIINDSLEFLFVKKVFKLDLDFL